MGFLHIIVGLIGAYLVYLTFAMKESTEGVWVNRIANFWIELDDRKKSIGESTKILFSKLADQVSLAFTRVFGQKLISVRVIGMSGSLSFASFFLFLAAVVASVCYLIFTHSQLMKADFSTQVPLLIVFGIGLLVVGGVCLLLAVLPVLSRFRIFAWLSCIPTALFSSFFVYRLILRHNANAGQYSSVLALAISFASDLLLLVLVRQSLRWILIRTTLTRIVAAIAAQFMALFLFFVVPYRLPLVWRPEMAKTSLGRALVVVVLLNVPTAVFSVAFVFSLCVVLIHRLIWPVLSDFTYILARNDVLDKRGLVRSIGIVFILYGVGSHTFWYYLSEKLLK